MPFIEFLGIRKESKSAIIREWSGMCSDICLISFKAAVGAKMLLSKFFSFRSWNYLRTSCMRLKNPSFLIILFAAIWSIVGMD